MTVSKKQVSSLTLGEQVVTDVGAMSTLTVGSKEYDGSAPVTVTAADLGLGSAYVPKGSKTVAEINALASANMAPGHVYNVSDSGSVTDGLGGAPLAVLAGDNIVCVEESGNKRWDKLAGTVDLSAYATKAEIVPTTGGTAISVAAGVVSVDIDKSTAITASTTLEQLITLLGGTITTAESGS